MKNFVVSGARGKRFPQPAKTHDMDDIGHRDQLFKFRTRDDNCAATLGLVSEKTVYFGFRSHVDTLRRLIHQQNFSVAFKHSRQCDLLLISAAELACQCLSLWRSDKQLADITRRHFALFGQ